jgi:ABC-2 type transport system ATP-binding protein
MESVEELCDHIALIDKSNKILDGKLQDIKKQFKSNTFEVGVSSANEKELLNVLKSKFSIAPTTFKSIHDDVKVKIQIDPLSSPNELLSFLTKQGQVNHFTEVIPSASDIFIQSVQNN